MALDQATNVLKSGGTALAFCDFFIDTEYALYLLDIDESIKTDKQGLKPMLEACRMLIQETKF